jgi:hypothetical protein
MMKPRSEPSMPQLERRSAGSRKFLIRLWIACLFFPVVHYLVIVFTADTQGSPSSFLLVVLGLLRIACCLWLFARLSASPARFRWLLLAAGAAMAHTSTEIYFWRGLLFSSHTYLSTPASLLTAFACIPILLAIASNSSRKDPPAVREIDLALSFMLGSLFLALILSPAVQASSAAGVLSINRMIDCENLFLAICAALQFLASDDAEDRRFFYVFLGYMVVAAPLVSVRNRWAAQYPMAIWDLALDVSPLLFLLYALHPMPAWVRHFRPSARTVHLARGGSPLFMSLALTLLGIGVSRSHFYAGSAGILLGITGYGLRNAVIHGRLLETEGSQTTTGRAGFQRWPDRHSESAFLRRNVAAGMACHRRVGQLVSRPDDRYRLL